jgi:hypothetical protein
MSALYSGFEHDPEKHALGLDPRMAPVFLGTNAKRLPGDHAPKIGLDGSSPI